MQDKNIPVRRRFTPINKVPAATKYSLVALALTVNVELTTNVTINTDRVLP